MVKQKVLINDGLSFLVFWQKPETWAEMIYKWASSSGRIGTVETVEGLVSGDETTGEEFYDMPMNFAFHVLKTLEKSKKAEMFKVGDGYAIKFF
jgi:ESCRT-II complex subunit VPS25